METFKITDGNEVMFCF